MRNETFEIGKMYKHSGGRLLKIVGTAQTFYHGLCLIGEEEKGELTPVGFDTTHFTNWKEVKGDFKVNK